MSSNYFKDIQNSSWHFLRIAQELQVHNTFCVTSSIKTSTLLYAVG